VFPADLDKWRSSTTAALAEPEEARASPQATRQDRKRIKELGGFYGTTGNPQLQPFGVPVPKKLGGAFFGPSWKANGQFCLRIGPHGSVAFVPSVDLGGFKN